MGKRGGKKWRDDRGQGFKNRPQFEDRRDSGRPDDRKRSGPSGQQVPPAKRPKLPPINREKVCPLLLRIFPRKGSHHRLEYFENRDKLPEQEIQVHTWQDASLRELCDLIQDVNTDAKKPNARIAFALVYPDRTGRNTMRQIGVVHSTRTSNDDEATLRELKFQTGDYMSVAVTEF